MEIDGKLSSYVCSRSLVPMIGPAHCFVRPVPQAGLEQQSTCSSEVSLLFG